MSLIQKDATESALLSGQNRRTAVVPILEIFISQLFSFTFGVDNSVLNDVSQKNGLNILKIHSFVELNDYYRIM